jgi:hypothetical protein
MDYMDNVDQDDCRLLEEMHGHEQKLKQGQKKVHGHGQGQQGGRV